MSRTGVEKKPPWAAVPLELKSLIAERLGSPVVRGERVYGGYGPGPSFRLLLANGERAFTKSMSPDSSDVQRKVFSQELRVYKELAEHITPWAPSFLGEAKHEQWHALILEDLGPKSAPPWSISKARIAAHGLAELHSSTRDVSFPSWIPRPGELDVFEPQMWSQTVSVETLQKVAGLAADPEAAMKWLERFVPDLSGVSDRLKEADGHWSLMHLDVRSDNLRIVDGKLRLFDWPFTCIGPPELDIVNFAQTVWAEGFFDGETVLRWYEDVRPLRQDVVTAAVVAISNFFAHRSWQPDMPRLPRIRPWQRQQLKVTLRWAATRLDLPDPEWVDGIVGV